MSLRESIEYGMRVTPAVYDASREVVARARERIDAVFSEFDILLAPSAPGEAPHGLETPAAPCSIAAGRCWDCLASPFRRSQVRTGFRSGCRSWADTGTMHRHSPARSGCIAVWKQVIRRAPWLDPWLAGVATQTHAEHRRRLGALMRRCVDRAAAPVVK